MTLTRSRTIQYVGILLALGLIAVGYWYFNVRAGVRTNTTAGQLAGTNDMANGLAAYWKFDENTGTSTTDGSTNGATGTLTNGPTWTTGQIGYAVDFDGTDDYVTTPDSEPLELALERSKFTIAGWFNRDTFTTDDTIVAKRNGITAGDVGYLVYIDDATDQIVFEFSDGVDEVSTVSTTTFTATGWHHFVITQRLDIDGNPRVYIDGQLETASITGNINDMEPVGNAVAMRVGAESDGGNPFDGKLDEIRYYHHRAFTTEQVAELYRLTSPTGVDTGLKGYWSFDGQERGDYVYDQSGAGNRGTPFGTGTMPAPTPAAGRVGQALDFDGTDDYIQLDSQASLDDIANMTTCIWANPTGATDGSLISKDDSVTGWNVVGNNTGVNAITFYKGWTGGVTYGEWRTADNTFLDNQWSHICVTYSNSSAANDPIFYVNGVSVAFTEINAPSGTVVSDATFAANIGSYSSGAGAFFDGRLDEARIYNRILTAAEVRNLYDRSAPDKTNTGGTQAQGGGDLGAGLALYWPLDENTGTNADDKSANANDGTLTGGPTWTTGQIGSAVDFDGTDDYIAVADPASGVLDFTPPVTVPAAGDVWSISLWFNRDTATTDDTLIAKKNSQTTNTDDGYIVWIDDATDEINVRLDDNTAVDETSTSSTTTYTSAGWHHLVVVLDGDHFEGVLGMNNCPYIFVDGLHVTDASTCANYLHYVDDTSNALAFTVGAESDGGNPFDGKMDDVRVYNRIITPDDIIALYRNSVTTSGIDTGLRGYWSFNSPDMGITNGGVAYDRSGGGNWGELLNGPTLVRGRVGQAFRFDGANDHVSVLAATPLNDQHTFTYAAWIYPTGASCGNGYGRIIEKGTGSGVKKSLYIDCSGASGDRTLYGTVDTATTDALSYTANGALVYNEWQHIAMTYDDAGDRKVRLYINGREQLYAAQTAGTGAVATDTTDNIAIGATPGTQFFAFIGMIDEPRIYSRVLTASELSSISAAGAPDKTNTSVSTPQGTGRLDSGLAGYWKLDETVGSSASDVSTNSNTGTLTNMENADWVAGRIGNGLSFDGTNEYVTGTAPALNAPITLCAWYKPASASDIFDGTAALDAVAILRSSSANYEAFAIGMRSSGAFNADAWAGALDDTDGNYSTATGATELFTAGDTWQHICGVFASSNSREVYLNGVLDGSDTGTENAQVGNLFVGVGTNSTTLVDYAEGVVDEVRVYNRTLSPEEIANLYRLTTPTGTDTGLKGYWSFNGTDLSGTTAYDRSGAGNAGTLTNGPVKARGKLGQAVNFDGSNDYVNLGSPASVENLTSKTVCSWIYPETIPSTFATIAAKLDGVGWQFEMTNNNGNNRVGIYQVFNVVSGTWKSPVDSVPFNTWSHVCITYDNSSTSNDPVIYVNGASVPVEETQGPPSGTVSSDAGQPLYIGAASSTGAVEFFDGTIDEVRIYNRILSASEIKALYSSGK